MTGSYRKIPIDDFLYPEIARTLRPGVLQPEPQVPAASWWDEVEEPAPPARETIVRSFDGRPTRVSTSRELVAARVFTWPVYDVNGYYRALGLGWPFRPSKRELREAYQRCGGPDDEYATYAFKRLLDADFRRRYDARPPGAPMDDKYRWIALKRTAARWAAAQTLATGRTHDSGEFVPADLRARMDADIAREQSGAAPVEQVREIGSWGFGYYRWDAVRADLGKLSHWQAMLLAACWAAGVRGSFAVGVLGDQPHQAVRAWHDGSDIAFLGEDVEPSPALAQEVVTDYLTRPLNRRFDTAIPFDLVNSGPTTLDEQLIPLSAQVRSSTPEEEFMSEDEELLDFATGGLAAADHAKAIAAARKAQWGQVYLTQYLQDDQDRVLARFITDEQDLIETLQHGLVPTKPAPKDKPADRSWPAQLPAVCRYTPRKDRRPAFSECYICDYMRDEKGEKLFAGTRLWGLAAIREEVLGTPEMVTAGTIQPHQVGQPVSYRDKTEELDELDENNKPTGRKVQSKLIVIVNMAQSNFWSPLMTNKVYFGTIVDRDYLVVRKGARQQSGGGRRGGKVLYEFVPVNPAYVQHPETGQTVQLDLRDPKLAAAYEGHGMDLPRLRKHVARMASAKYYARFFDPRVEVPWAEQDETSGPASGPSPQAQANQQAGESATSEPTTGPVADQLAAMREQMRASLLQDNPPPSAGGTEADTPVVSPL